MEEEASDPDKQISDETNEENSVMALGQGVVNAFCRKVGKEQICECIHYLGRVVGRIVVLQYS